MPAPRRAILANIHEQKLDPKKSYSKLDKSGKLVEESSFTDNKKVKEDKPIVFASLDKVEKTQNDVLDQEILQASQQAKEEILESKTENLVESLAETTETQQEKIEITLAI